MSDVGAWEPAAKLGASHAQALDAAAAGIAEDALAVDEAVAARLRQVFFAAPDERAGLFDDEPSPRLVGWARALTLAEENIPGCEGGAKSPVIALARLLRSRGDYPHELTPWIKRVSSNRFLPYGSLMDRLQS
jgi:hypothetical protein